MREPLPHHWVVRSRHPTSEGVVRYESCHCGVARIRTERTDPDADPDDDPGAGQATRRTSRTIRVVTTSQTIAATP